MAKARTVSEVFAEQLAQTRTSRDWSQEKLAEVLGEMGWPTHQTAIAKMEAGKRRVTIEDALRLAAALDVSPVALFLPRDGSDVLLSPVLRLPGDLARDWVAGLRLRLVSVRGRRAWPPRQPTRDSIERRTAFWRSQRSDAELRAFERDGIASLVRHVHDLVAATAAGDREAMAAEATAIRNEADRQLEDLEEG